MIKLNQDPKNLDNGNNYILSINPNNREFRRNQAKYLRLKEKQRLKKEKQK